MISETIALYPGRKDVYLTTYLQNELGELNKGPRPAVLICPGGAYLGCSDREAQPVALKFAAMGYHAFVLRYSTYGQGQWPGIDITEPKTVCQHPMPMREIGLAMKIINEQANAWFVDTDKIALCGFSAGAHNAAMFATHWHDPIITDYLRISREKIKPAALIFAYGVSDYMLLKETAQLELAQGNGVMAQLFAAADLSLLGTRLPTDEQLLSVSPARLISKQVPPTFIWATADDEIVPANQSLALAMALAAKKIPYELHIYESGVHGLSLATAASAVTAEQINPAASGWIDLAQTWLNKHFQ